MNNKINIYKKAKMALIAISCVVFFIKCTSSANTDANINGAKLPKVLFITTGIDFDQQAPDLPKGISIAIQTFNKRGIPVRLEPRDVLFDFDYLSKYNIIILSTASGYHDVDRKYSLTYMEDAELNNLTRFVKEGGVIIAGDNVGRNYFDGKDRIGLYQFLEPEHYAFSNAIGFTMEERNMKGYSISGDIDSTLKGEFMTSADYDSWSLVPDSIISDKLKVLAYWENGSDSVAAITENSYKNGIVFLLASSNFIHPANNGGYWSVDQIDAFYNYVADAYFKKNNISISLNPWPYGHDFAFCVSFNPEGTIENYKSVNEQLSKHGVKATYFVNGRLNDTIKDFLTSKNAFIESTGFHYLNYKNLNHAAALNDILLNENKWDKKFMGFRFPYTTPNFTGLLVLDRHNYSFESSISINNIEFLQGSVFPYNIVIASEKFYKSTNILEIGPTYHDDYFFLKGIAEETYVTSNQLYKDVLLYEQYLNDFWDYCIKPNNGLMQYLGHPGLIGYNTTTFSALKNLIVKVKEDNTWITSINEVANYRKDFEKLIFYVDEKKDKIIISVKGPDDVLVKGLTINIEFNPLSIETNKGKAEIQQSKDSYSIIFDAFNEQKIIINR
jgi:peptidoglycan/xylan/chitin deacetylase (PgdA/CDA1 family)